MKLRTIFPGVSALRNCLFALLAVWLLAPGSAGAGISFGLSSAVRSAVKKLPPKKPAAPVIHDLAPVIASLTAVPASVSTGTATTITCSASDPDGDPLTYAWSAANGALTGSGRQVSWTAPGVRGTFAINVTVSDGRGGSAAGSVNVGVSAAGYSIPAEGFETGDLLKLPWAAGGDAPWVVQSAEKHGGSYAARAGTVDDDQTSELSVTFVTAEDGDISFYRKVSSEENFDFLEFYIDGDFQEAWSGEVGWAPVSYPVTAGTHTFKWVYTKDSSDASGSDTAWVDDILFPEITADRPPVISSLAAVPASISTGAAAIVTCSATDPDGDTLTYSWSAASGNISGVGPVTTWSAPSSSGTYIISCTVSDGKGGTAALSTTVAVFAGTNNPPAISSMTASPPGVSTGAAVVITCSASDPDGDAMTYDWSAASGTKTGSGSSISWTAPGSSGTYLIGVTVSDGRGGSASGSINLSVFPVLNENFETGDFSRFPWTAGGDAGWTVQGSVTHGGTSAARAGTVADSQTSVLSVAVDAAQSGTLSFFRKVSSASGDLLGFYVDGVLKDSWSGELDWEQENYTVTAGPHVLKWVYSKDGSGASGTDTAWLDDIVFSGS